MAIKWWTCECGRFVFSLRGLLSTIFLSCLLAWMARPLVSYNWRGSRNASYECQVEGNGYFVISPLFDSRPVLAVKKEVLWCDRTGLLRAGRDDGQWRVYPEVFVDISNGETWEILRNGQIVTRRGRDEPVQQGRVSLLSIPISKRMSGSTDGAIRVPDLVPDGWWTVPGEDGGGSINVVSVRQRTDELEK